MICSISVVPERGMPRTKIGIGEVIAAAGFRRDQLAREHRLDAVEQSERGFFVIGDRRALAGVAREQVLERAR